MNIREATNLVAWCLDPQDIAASCFGAALSRPPHMWFPHNVRSYLSCRVSKSTTFFHFFKDVSRNDRSSVPTLFNATVHYSTEFQYPLDKFEKTDDSVTVRGLMRHGFSGRTAVKRWKKVTWCLGLFFFSFSLYEFCRRSPWHTAFTMAFTYLSPSFWVMETQATRRCPNASPNS